MMIMKMVEGHGDDQMLKAWKRRKRKTKRLKAKVYLIGAFVLVIETL